MVPQPLPAYGARHGHTHSTPALGPRARLYPIRHHGSRPAFCPPLLCVCGSTMRLSGALMVAAIERSARGRRQQRSHGADVGLAATRQRVSPTTYRITKR
jgi:hypothetical protein